MATEIENINPLTKISKKLMVPLVSIIISFILIIFIVNILDQDILLAIQSMTIDIFFDEFGEFDLTTFLNVFFYATPLILTGLSVAVAFRAGMFNIGTEGQVVIGGFSTALVGSAIALNGGNMTIPIINVSFYMPPIILMPMLIVLGIIGGALWALVPAILKTRGVHEVITTIMMNYIANTLMIFLIGAADSPFSDKNLAGNASPQTAPIPTNARIPTIFGRDLSLLHWGFVLNTIVVVIIYVILWRTKLGYETRAVGHNTNASKYGGISVNRNLIIVMLISGGLGGLAGSLIVMGPLYGFFLYGSTAGMGFDGIAIAIIGENHPFGVLLGAILFGWLQASSTKLQQNQIPKDIANTMKGFIVLIVAVPLFSKMIITAISKSGWYNETVQYYKKTLGSSPSTRRRAGFLLVFFYFLIIMFLFFMRSIFHNVIIFLKWFWDYILIRKLLLTSWTLFLFLATIYLDISGFLKFADGNTGAVFDISVPEGIIRDVFTSLSNLSHELLFTSDLYFNLSIVGGIITLFFVFVLLLIRRNNSPNSQASVTFFIVFFAIFLFFNLINFAGQDVVLFATTALITAYIVFQEVRARSSKTQITPQTTLEDEITDVTESTDRMVTIYSGIIISYLVLAGLIVAAESFSLPFQLNLFFFTLNDFGALIGLIGIFILPGIYFYLKRIRIKTENTIVNLLPLFFIISAIAFSFVSVNLIFKMNPYLLFTQTVSIAAPIGFAALGGMYSEKSGVVNIGLEGMMLSGAFVAVWVTFATNDPWFGVLGAMVAGLVMGLLHAVASIKFRADQVVVGVAINILASALSMLGLVLVYDVRGTSPLVRGLTNVKLPFLEEIPVIGETLYNLSGGNSGLSPLVYLFIFLIFLSYWIIERTSFGLRVRAVGEHPRAADTLGINVFKMRYICVVLSGVLAALGGAQLTLGWAPIFGRDMTTGRGFVALAALIFGAWSPIGAGFASLLFGFAIAFRRQIEALGINWAISIFGFIWRFEKLTQMLPYLLTIIAVATVAKRMRPPAADGIPYEKEG